MTVLDAGAPAPVRPAPSSRAEITREVRLAVVMYGGVSLAIYINGVAQELLRLVRATALTPEGKDLRHATVGGTEAVYRTIACMLGGEDGPSVAIPAEGDGAPPVRVRFVIDTISGTSAGGINGIFLAKALANGQRLDALQDLWVTEGDLGVLLNDKHSRVRDTWVREGNPPASLLNGARMYQRLVSAFEGMEKDGGDALVPEVDLFVTTTDVRGLPVNLRLADGVVRERRYKHAFHFKFRDGAGGQASANDFTRGRNRLLAFAARCTSSFPVAFEPMTLAAAAASHVASSDRLGYESPDERDDLANYFPQHRDAAAANKAGSHEYLEHRPFADGGYLDNKPFGYPIDALTDRHGGVPADRKLVYVEPSTDHVSSDAAVGPKHMPNAFENAGIALSLARRETIREDLRRVLDRNRLVERVERVTARLEEDIAKLRGRGERLAQYHKDFATLGLDAMMQQPGGGIAYGGYHRLKVAAITDALARYVANTFKFADESDEYQAVRLIVREWRDARYTDYKPAPDAAKQTQNRFICDFDLSYRVRRLAFVLNKVDHLLCLDLRAVQILDVRVGCPKPTVLRDKEAFQGRLSDIRARLLPELRRLRVLYDALFEPRGTWRHDRAYTEFTADPDLKPARTALEGKFASLSTGIGVGALHALLNEPAEKLRAQHAQRLLGNGPGSFRARIDDTADALAELLATAAKSAKTACEAELGPPPSNDSAATTPHAPPTPPLDEQGHIDYAAVAHQVVAEYFYGFDPFDLVLFPMLYETGIGDEVAQIDVLRISPDDAQALMAPDPTGRRRKLAGEMLGHFGAFLDPSFRANDILWGRLDGAERLISMLLPGPALEGARTELTARAHRAILDETFATPQREKLASTMATALLRGGRLPAEPDSARLAHRDAALRLRGLLDPEQLREYFGSSTYSADTTLDARATLQVGARATAVVGRMLDGIKDRPPGAGAAARWLTRLGRGLWTLVEVSVPHAATRSVARHWIGLLVLFALVLVIGGSLLAAQTVVQFGFTLLGITLGVLVLTLALGDVMRGGRPRRRLAVSGLLALGLGAVVLLAWTRRTAWFPLAHPDLAPFRRYEQPPATWDPAPAAGVTGGPVTAQFLGTTSLLFRDGETAILSDGFVSRPGMGRVLLGRLTPDAARVRSTLQRLGVDSIAAVFTGHSHYDHALDAPEFARQAKAVLVGSPSTVNIGRGRNLPEHQLRPVRDGDTLRFGKFRLTFIEARHSPGDRVPGIVDARLAPPARVGAWKTGATWSVLIEHEGRTLLVHGSAGYKPGALRGRHADVVYLGIGGLGRQSDAFVDAYWSEIVRATGARRVILVHWDDFFRSLDEPLRPMPYAFDDFPGGVQHVLRRAAADGVQVLLPVPWQLADPFAGLEADPSVGFTHRETSPR